MLIIIKNSINKKWRLISILTINFYIYYYYQKFVCIKWLAKVYKKHIAQNSEKEKTLITHQKKSP